MTEEIKHINKKNQEYIAEGNRMTEEIIIDGIDVSGCVNRNDFKLALYDCYLNGGCQCKDEPNCYYKQLKRLEQREKALTEIADNLQKRNHDLTLMNECLEQENKELRCKVEQLTQQLKN